MVLAAMWLAGCGSSSSGSGNSGTSGTSGTNRTTGVLVVTIDWPATSRLIPANTQSLTILLAGNAPGLSTPIQQLITPGTSSTTFPGLLAGSYTLTIGAWSTANGTGPLLAGATNGNVVIVVNQTTTTDVSLVSQVASVTAALSLPFTDDATADSVTVTLTAWSAANSMVPIAPTKVNWTTSRPDVASIPVANGNPITIYPETGSVLTGSAAVTIGGTYAEGTGATAVSFSANTILTVYSANNTGHLAIGISR
jgi:hypothetical protein